MFTDQQYSKLFDKNISFSSLMHFAKDKRLVEPFSIANILEWSEQDLKVKGTMDFYPMELAQVIYYNGF